MLQIVTGRFFKPGNPMRRNMVRDTLYTNCSFLPPDPVQLEVGRLLPPSLPSPISAVTVEVEEWLETVEDDGSESILVSTGGKELVDDLAFVLSFALDATFSRDHNLVHDLIEDAWEPTRRRDTPSAPLKRTFDPHTLVLEDAVADLDAFLLALIDLPQSQFERVMRAIRRMVRAVRGAVTDPTAAYTDIVTALESLSDPDVDAPVTWAQYPHGKAKLIDAALEAVSPEVVERIHQAILEADKVGARRRFIVSTMAQVSEEYFRSEAVGAEQPVRSTDLQRVLGVAYDIRSGNSHVLEELPRETWVFAGAETVDLVDSVPGGRSGLVLTIQGLWRLARHVVRNYVERADGDGGEDGTFPYRAHLPGRAVLKLSPELWIWHAESLGKDSALERFVGVLEVMAGVAAGRLEAPPDLRPLVEKAQRLAPGLAPSEERTALVAICAIWRAVMAPNLQPPGIDAFLEKYGGCLRTPGVTAFATSIVTGDAPWNSEALVRLADARDARRRRGKGGQSLPARFDSALQAAAAMALASEGQSEDAVRYAARAVEEMPGDPMVMEWEQLLRAGTVEELDLAALTIGPSHNPPDPASDLVDDALPDTTAADDVTTDA